MALHVPWPRRPLDIYARDGALFADGVALNIRGYNWFGSEGVHRVPFGLMERRSSDLFSFAAAQGFNALRLMFSWEDWVADELIPRDHFSPLRNARLVGATYREMLHVLVEEAAAHGTLVILACHRIRRQYATERNNIHAEWPGSWDGLWYDRLFDEARVQQLWGTVGAEFCGSWNVIGTDLMNEPYSCSWGDGGARDWRRGAEEMGNAVLAACPRWLIMVQGTSNPGMWGENLRGVSGAVPAAPSTNRSKSSSVPGGVRLRNQSKLVYSAHTYGPSLFLRSGGGPAQHSAPGFPANMAAA